MIRKLTDQVLTALNDRFAALCSGNGRPSIPPEQLLHALLLQVFYTIGLEQQLMEQLNYNLLFRWWLISGFRVMTVGGDSGCRSCLICYEKTLLLTQRALVVMAVSDLINLSMLLDEAKCSELIR